MKNVCSVEAGGPGTITVWILLVEFNSADKF